MENKSSGRTLDAKALLVLDDEVLLVVLELAQVIFSVLGEQAKLFESLIDLLVFLRHAVHHPAHRRAGLRRIMKEEQIKRLCLHCFQYRGFYFET